MIESISNKPNIKYTVCVAPKGVGEILSPVIADIEERGTYAKKTIIFCRTYSDFNEISTSLISTLCHCDVAHLLTPEDGSHPICQMFSASTEEKVKNDILVAFTNPQSSL